MGSGLTGLVGRDRELAELATLLDTAGTDGAAILLTGDPGVGKTVLLDATAELAVAKGTLASGGDDRGFVRGFRRQMSPSPGAGEISPLSTKMRR
ncbi:ATP-binding protein [Microbispora sp. NBRC 16548]|uniref:ATP-binding protein n=1 Tax=Microbispora sp. NBRC 16548 TaxID=3030994 RepID=UPI0024A20EBC|nr:ATP-binding protein [Microbispora sp. NBRC 16548]GLX11619.1 hypothetical protein Misp03_85450 [Microbispora sp. NBRC 16548]